MSAPPVLFVLGAARSGTTLLYKALCLHPEVSYISNWVRAFPALPQLAALNRVARHLPAARARAWFGHDGEEAYAYGRRRRLWLRAFPTPVEGEPVLARHGVPPPEARPSATPVEPRPIRRAIEIMTRAGGGRVFVNKRIANNWRVAQLLDALPEARFVELVRDGRAVAYSLSRVDWWRDGPLPWLGTTPREGQRAGHDPWDLCARNWVEEVRAVGAGLARVAPDRKLRITYEALVGDPPAVLDRVATFAGLGVDRAWCERIRTLRYPDRNDAWRFRLPPATTRRIERIQREVLVANGYDVG